MRWWRRSSGRHAAIPGNGEHARRAQERATADLLATTERRGEVERIASDIRRVKLDLLTADIVRHGLGGHR